MTGVVSAPFAARCGVHDAAREQAVQQTVQRIRDNGIDLVRFVWCDAHGALRGKALTAAAATKAMLDGVGMVGTLMLKDTSDRTVYKVFDPDSMTQLPRFAGAPNLMLLPDPHTFRTLPWAPGTAWVFCQPWYQDGTPVELDSRFQLQRALGRLADRGLGMVCGLEVEFHIYRIKGGWQGPDLDAEQAAWPGLPPEVSLIHPGYNMLSDGCMDLSEEPLRIVQRTAEGLGLPLTSLEVELGPSQVEAVFGATDALSAADNMVRFRNGVRQALRRAGYHATFICRPPFDHIMSSGWHLHQSVVSLATGQNEFMRQQAAPDTPVGDARSTLSDTGAAWLAGLLAHAQGMAALCTTTVNGYARLAPNALAPHAAVWGRDTRGAMLRVIGAVGDAATRIENRLGEPAANPYLYMASQVWAGLDGLNRGLVPPLAAASPYAEAAKAVDNDVARSNALPNNLPAALDALVADAVMQQGLGADGVALYTRIKQSEMRRHAEAADVRDFERREYFSRC